MEGQRPYAPKKRRTAAPLPAAFSVSLNRTCCFYGVRRLFLRYPLCGDTPQRPIQKTSPFTWKMECTVRTTQLLMRLRSIVVFAVHILHLPQGLVPVKDRYPHL